MKKILLIQLFVVLVTTINYAQPTFNWAYALNSQSPNSSSRYLYPSKIQSGINKDVYMTGYFNSQTNFDQVYNTINVLTPTDSMASFITKYNSAGNILWAKQLDANGLIKIQDFTLDLSDNIYVTGIFKGTVDFDPSATTYTITKDNSTANYNAFIAKYTSNGSLVWVNRLTGSFIKNKIGLDYINNIYIGGLKDSIPFFCKYSNSGSEIWRDSLVTTYSTSVEGFCVNSSGNVYISGITPNSIDMDPSVNTFYLNGYGNNRYLGMYDTNGSLVWCQYFPNAYPIGDMVSDIPGNLYVAGSHYLYGSQISKWDINGDQVWKKSFLFNSSNSKCVDISFNCSGNIIVSGFFSNPQLPDIGANFDPSGMSIYSITPRPTSNIDFYVASYKPSDGSLNWAKALAGSFVYSSEINNTYINFAGDIYLCGLYEYQSDFDFGPGSHIMNYSLGNKSLFFSKHTGCNAVGIEENSIENSIDVFPNPNNGVLNVEFNNASLGSLSENITIELINTLGQTVISKTITTENESINLKQFKSGIYFLKLMQNNNVIATKKVIRE